MTQSTTEIPPSKELSGSMELSGSAPALAKTSAASLNKIGIASSKVKHAAKQPNFLDLFRGPQLRKKTLLMLFAWIACSVIYTCMSFNTENLGDNLYVTWAVLAFVEAPACLLILTLNKVGRIWPCCLMFFLAGLCCLLTVPGDYVSSTLVIIFALSGKLCISVCYGIVFQITSELMPTCVRGLGIGFGSVVGDAGNILMPYIVYSAVVYKMLPMVIMGILSPAAAILVLFLPETVGQYMPETLEEAEEHGIVNWGTFFSHFKRVFVKRLTITGESSEKDAL